MKIPIWRLKKTNGITLGFFFAVVALENFSWLIPSTQYLIPGLLKFSDIGVISAILWIAYVLIGINSPKKYMYSKLPILFWGLIIVSSIAANHFFEQSYGLSFRQNRYIFVCMLLYYAIMKAMYSGKILRSDVLSILSFQAVVEIVLFLTQILLADYVTFIYAEMETRYGTARLRVSYLLALIFMFFCIDKILNNKNKVWNSIMALGGASVLVVVCKHRAPTMILLVTLVIAFFVWKKKTSTKIVVGIFVVIVGVCIVTNSTIVQDAISGIVSGDRNLDYRTTGRVYFLERLKLSPIVGFGEPNENCYAAQSASGYFDAHLLADNGIFGFLYCHGILGIVWVIALWIKLYKQSIYLYRKKKMYVYLLYVIFETGNLYMGMHWYFYYTLPFIICITLMDYDYQLAKRENICEEK